MTKLRDPDIIISTTAMTLWSCLGAFMLYQRLLPLALLCWFMTLLMPLLVRREIPLILSAIYIFGNIWFSGLAVANLFAAGHVRSLAPLMLGMAFLSGANCRRG